MMPALDERRWEEFQAHLASCAACTPQGECPVGHELLMVWGRADAEAGNQVIGRVEDEGPAEHLRNALQILQDGEEFKWTGEDHKAVVRLVRAALAKLEQVER